MKGLLVTLVALTLVSSLIIGGCSPATAPSPTTAPAKTASPPSTPITLKFAYDPPPTGAVVIGWNWWASELEKQSNGRVKVEFYPGGSLFSQAQAYDSVKAGIADITNVALQDNSPSFPVTNVVALPAAGFSDTTKEGYQDAYKAFMQLYNKYPQISDEYKNVHILFWNVMPAYRIVSKKQISVPDDLKGMKIGGGGLYAEIVKVAGGVPVMVIPPNSYEQLDKGVVTGVFVGWLHVRVYKLPEVATNYLEYGGFGQNVTQVLMNLKTWNSLPPDIQKLVTDLTPEAFARSSDNYIVQSQGGIQDAQAKNRIITTPDAAQKKLWDELAAPVQAQWVKDVQAKGISNGQDILNSLLSIRSQSGK